MVRIIPVLLYGILKILFGIGKSQRVRLLKERIVFLECRDLRKLDLRDVIPVLISGFLQFAVKVIHVQIVDFPAASEVLQEECLCFLRKDCHIQRVFFCFMKLYRHQHGVSLLLTIFCSLPVIRCTCG